MQAEAAVKNFVLSGDIVQRRVNDRTAVYHRLHGGLFFIDDAGRELMRSFMTQKIVSDSVLNGDASNRSDELIQQLIARRILIESDSTGAPYKSPPLEKR